MWVLTICRSGPTAVCLILIQWNWLLSSALQHNVCRYSEKHMRKPLYVVYKSLVCCRWKHISVQLLCADVQVFRWNGNTKMYLLDLSWVTPNTRVKLGFCRAMNLVMWSSTWQKCYCVSKDHRLEVIGCYNIIYNLGFCSIYSNKWRTDVIKAELSLRQRQMLNNCLLYFTPFFHRLR